MHDKQITNDIFHIYRFLSILTIFYKLFPLQKAGFSHTLHLNDE